MVELRKASGHLLAGGATVIVLTVVPTVVQAIIAGVGFVLEGQPLGLRGLVRLALPAFIAAVVYTAVIVFPAVWLLSRMAGPRGRLVLIPALALSGVIDVVLMSRGYWVPDATLPHWPVWVAGLAFGPAVYVYWSTLTSGEKAVKIADVSTGSS